jgi:hypothetical protein
MKDRKLNMEEFDRLLHRYDNSVKQGIYTMDEASDLLFKDHMKIIDKRVNAEVERMKTTIPEGYEIWKYDIKTFEPIFRKKQ